MSTTRSNSTEPLSPNARQLRSARRHRSRRQARLTQSYWAAEQDQVETGVAQDVRWELLRQHGDFTLAYSTVVQPRLFHFGGPDGFVAHRTRWGVTCALGDPVCDASQRLPLIQEFIREHRRPMFCQVSHATAEVLSELGYVINPMGIDTTLRLSEYTCAGKQKEWLRYAGNWTQRRGYEIQEATFAKVTADCVESISEAWRQTRTIKHKEVRFLNRPIVLTDEPDVRKFFLIDPKGQTLAFVFLDPLYRDGRVVGYATSFKRRHPDAPQYGEQAIMKYIIEQLKSESVEQLKLGLSPLASLDTGEFAHGRATQWLFSKTYDSRMVNKFFYHLKGHASYKRRFYGEEEAVYLAMPTRFSPRRLAALLAMCGIF